MGARLAAPPVAAGCYALFAGQPSTSAYAGSAPLRRPGRNVPRPTFHQGSARPPTEDTPLRSRWLKPGGAVATVAASAVLLLHRRLRAISTRPRARLSGRRASQTNAAPVERSGSAWLSPVAYLATLVLSRWSFHALGLGNVNTSIWLAKVTVLTHTIVFAIVAALTSRPDKTKGSGKLQMIGIVAAIEVLTFVVLSRVSSAMHAGLFVLCLSGMAVPYVVAFSSTLLRKRYHLSTWIGATLVGVGVACSMPLTGQQMSLPLVFLAAAALCLPGLGLIAKEMLLHGSISGTRKEMGVFSVAALTSFAQLLGLLIPIELHSPGVAAARATAVATTAGPGVVAIALYCLTSGCVRIALIWALRETSALSISLVNAITVPLTAALFPTPEAKLGISVALLGVAVCATAPPPNVPGRKRLNNALPKRGMGYPNDGTWVPQDTSKNSGGKGNPVEVTKIENPELRAQELKANTDFVITASTGLVTSSAQQDVAEISGAAGRAATGAFVSVFAAVAAGAAVTAGVVVAAGAAVTAGAVMVTAEVVKNREEASKGLGP